MTITQRMTGRVPTSKFTWAVALVCVVLLVLSSSVTCANPAAVFVAKRVGQWVLSALGSYALGKAIDYATGQDLRGELESTIAPMLVEIAKSSGKKREALEEQLDISRRQLEIIAALLDAQGDDLSALRAEQESLLQRADELADRLTKLEAAVDELGDRTDRLERRVEELDQRVGQVEKALISECLDRRGSSRRGAVGYLVDAGGGQVLSDDFNDSMIDLSAKVYLDSCTPNLTERGVLIQLSLATRGLDQELVLYATFKDVRAMVAGKSPAQAYRRFEFPLGRPAYAVDGQVREFFVPYSDIPFFSRTDRAALALVVTYDGRPRYALADRVLSCYPGERMTCQWR